MKPDILRDPKNIIPFWNLGQELYFKSPYIGWCYFDHHFLVDEQNGTFVEQNVDEKPYYYSISNSDGGNFYYYKIFVSENHLLLKIIIGIENETRKYFNESTFPNYRDL